MLKSVKYFSENLEKWLAANNINGLLVGTSEGMYP